MAFVPLDAQTILIGDSTSIFASLEHNQFAPRPPAAGSVLARAAEMDANYEVWVLVSTAEMLGSDRLAAMFSGGDGDRTPVVLRPASPSGMAWPRTWWSDSRPRR